MNIVFSTIVTRTITIADVRNRSTYPPPDIQTSPTVKSNMNAMTALNNTRNFLVAGFSINELLKLTTLPGS